MNTELLITLVVLLVEVAILGLCYVRARKPVNPLRPRLIPYAPVILFLGLAILVTAAHTISVLQGHRLEGRTNKGMGGGMGGTGRTGY
jgi:hypothetical protein